VLPRIHVEIGIQFVGDVIEIFEKVMDALAAIGSHFCVAANLIDGQHSGAGKGHEQLDPFDWFLRGIAQLGNFSFGQGIATAGEGGHTEAYQQKYGS
jgi:hypothetical protein